MRTFSSLFLESVVRYPEKTFIRRANGEIYTYEQSGKIVAGILLQLNELGIQKGDRIAVFAELNFPAIFMIIAGYSSGIVCMPIGPRFSYSFLKDAATRVRAKKIFCDEDTLKTVSEQNEKPLHFVSKKANSLGDGELQLNYQISAEDSINVIRLAQQDIYDDSVLKLMCTSGSTGKPNIVIRRNRVFPVIEDQVRKVCGENPKFLLAASLTHGFAHTTLSTILSMGGDIAIPSKIDTMVEIDEVRKFDPQVLPFTPRVLRSLFFQAQEKGYSEIFGPSAKAIVMVGGKPDESFLKPLIQKGIEFFEFYGSSESGLCVGTPYGSLKQGYSGRVLPFADVKLAQDGEILVKSPNSAMGYYDDEAKTNEVFGKDGFVRTGDLGVFSEDGYLKILGRKKDVFSTFEGSSVFPTRIESMIETLPWVDQVFLVGDGMPYIAACIVLKGQTLETNSADSYLDKVKFAEVYKRFSKDLENINLNLETIEKIHRFSLFSKPFDSKAYSYVSGGKVNRTRKAFLILYSNRIQEFYEKQAPDVGCLKVTN